jgi:DNA-binding PadR family transcriptional regulator
MGKAADTLPGTLDMLILNAVSLSPLHGYGVLQRIRQISGEIFDSLSLLSVIKEWLSSARSKSPALK